MLIAKYATCIVDGCGKSTHGKAYCDKHMGEIRKGKREKVGMSPEMKAVIQSACCKAHCTTGARHEYGDQYCKECGNACLWKPPMSS